MVPLTGLEPVQVALADFKSAVSTYSTIAAYEITPGCLRRTDTSRGTSGGTSQKLQLFEYEKPLEINDFSDVPQGMGHRILSPRCLPFHHSGILPNYFSIVL